MPESRIDPDFPCSLYAVTCVTPALGSRSSTIDVPLPDHRLAQTAMRALEVDQELSPLVSRTFSLPVQDGNVLRTQYKAATNRMLRVAVNGFMESLGVVLQVMQELDIDVLDDQNK